MIVVSSTGRRRWAPVRRMASRVVAGRGAQPIEGVDQDDVVVHHDTGQGNDTDARHDDAEGLVGDEQGRSSRRPST